MNAKRCTSSSDGRVIGAEMDTRDGTVPTLRGRFRFSLDIIISLYSLD